MVKVSKISLAAAGLAISVSFGAGALSAQEAPVVARVGDATITETEVSLAAADFANELAQVPEAQRRGILVNVLVDMELLAQAGEDAGLDKAPEFEKRVEFLRRRALRNAFVEQELVNSLTDEEVKAAYDRQIASFKPQEELRARHILVGSREEAEKIIAELDAGGSFEELAAENSTDGTAQNGGDLGYFSRGQMVDPFEDAVFELEAGSYTKEPVETQFGWHVIKLEDKRMSAPPPLADVEDQVRTILLRQKFEETMAALRAKYKVEIVDPSLAEPGRPDAAPADDATPADGAAPAPEGSETPKQ